MDNEDITQKIASVVEAGKRAGIIDRLLSGVSYLGVLSLLPVILHVKSDYVRFHAKQGLLLFIGEIIFTLVWIIPFIGWVAGFLGWIICLILSLVGLIKSLAGRYWRAPVLSRFVDKVKFQF